MLMLFPTLQVPGLGDIEFYRDHKDPYQFYALRSIPKIARDPEGNPMMSFLFFERDIDIARLSVKEDELAEPQLGQLLFTTDLGLTEKEHEKAAKYIKKILADEANSFVRLYNNLLKRRHIPIAPKDMPEPKIGTPNTWKNGVARLKVLEGLPSTFKKSSSHEVKPSLIGSNSAAFYVTLGMEGSQMYYDAFTKGYKETDEEVTPLHAIVEYDLLGYALIPSLEVKLWARSTEIYNYLKWNWESYSKSRHGYYYRRRKGNSTTTRDTRSVSISRSDISAMTEQMWEDKVIRVEISDFSELGMNDDEAKELHSQLKVTLINMVTETIIPQFFEAGLTEMLEDKEKEEDEDLQDENNDTPEDTNWYTPSQSRTYYFRENMDVTKVTNLSFHFKENRAVEFRRFPNGTLSVDLTDEELENLVKRIDLTSPYVQVLPVFLSVNAVFEEDNIHSIVTNLKYEEKDHETGLIRKKAKSYIFKTGKEDFNFNVTMAKDKEGRAIDRYDAVAKINYIGTAESPPEIRLNGISDQQLVFSYDRLGFVTVKVAAGDINWEKITDVVINFEYIAEPDKPDTRKEVRISKEEPLDTWKCFTYGHSSKEYRYKIKYIYTDGSESETNWKEEVSESLTIDDDLVGRVRASFDVSVDRDTVNSVKLEVLYEDKHNNVKEEHSHWFNSTATWDWTIQLREGGTTKFKYRYIIEYKDDVIQTTDWVTGEHEGDIPIFQAKRYRAKLTIDGFGIDWDKWRIVYMTAQYEDSDYNYEVSKSFRLSERDNYHEFEALAFQPNRLRNFFYSAKYVPSDREEEVVDTDMVEVGSNFLILEEPE